MPHLHQNKKVSFVKLNKHLTIILVLVLLAYFTIQIGVTSIVGTKGDALDQIRQEKDQLRQENEILSAKIDKAKAITAAANYIKEFDLKSKNIHFLQEPNTNNVALAK